MSVAFLCVLAAIPLGAGLKLFTFLDHWVYFPFFPNIFDIMLLILTSLYLWYRVARRVSKWFKGEKKHQKRPPKDPLLRILD